MSIDPFWSAVTSSSITAILGVLGGRLSNGSRKSRKTLLEQQVEGQGQRIDRLEEETRLMLRVINGLDLHRTQLSKQLIDLGQAPIRAPEFLDGSLQDLRDFNRNA